MDFILGVAVSLHLGLEGDYNAIHPSIMLEKNNYIAGVYYNSEREISKFAGYRFDFNESANVEMGIVDGYSSADILPMVKFNYKQFFVTPAYEKFSNSTGLVIGTEWRF